MGRRENGSLYVPVGVPKKKTRYEILAEKYLLPPLREILRAVGMALAISAAVIVILFLTGLRLKTFESDTGLTYRYFGWIYGGRPALGSLHISDGTSAKVVGGEIRYSDGSVYDGDVVNCMKHGKGELKFEDGSEYKGEFINDQYSGKGKYTRKDGSGYEGEYKNGLYHGNGTLTVAGLGTYTGGFQKGMKDGEGSFVYENGDSFKGTYRNDIRVEGVYKWNDGDSIEGSFIGNMPSRTEKLIYTDEDGRDFLVYYDYVSASLEEKQPYQRPSEPEEGPEDSEDGTVG